MNEKDKQLFLEDFKKANKSKKLDMWYFAIEQEAIWDEIMDEMSKIASMKMLKEGSKPTIVEE